MMSKKSNIYLFNSLQSVEVEFSKTESLIISKLLDMNNRISGNEHDSLNILSREILRIFEYTSTSLWSQIDRVCISIRDSLSNQIYIASTDQNDLVSENILVNGYSCIVDENSSLMSLKDGEIRTYDDIKNIISSFDSSGRQVQRSIRLIQLTNIKSGLTIPLIRNGKTFGFLFLNSTKLNVFNALSSQDYSILCLIKLLVQNMTTKKSTFLIDQKMFGAIENIQNKNQISIIDLKRDLEKACRNYFNRDILFSIKADFNPSFLLPHRKYINAVIVILKNIVNLNSVKNVSIEIKTEKDQELISEISFLNFNCELENSINNIEELVMDLKVKKLNNKIIFSLKYELMIENLLYSIG